MNKFVAIVNVIAWSGFWAFGFLALSAEGLSDRQLVIAAILAFAGLISGVFAWQRLSRAAEAKGHAKATSQPDAAARDRVKSQGSV